MATVDIVGHPVEVAVVLDDIRAVALSAKRLCCGRLVGVETVLTTADAVGIEVMA